MIDYFIYMYIYYNTYLYIYVVIIIIIVQPIHSFQYQDNQRKPNKNSFLFVYD